MYRRLQRLFDLIEDFDIITLQEVFTDSFKNKIIRVAHTKGFEYHQMGPSARILQGKFTDSGLLILSKYPIIKSSLLTFKDGLKSGIYIRIKI